MTLAADVRSAFGSVRRGGWLSVTVVLIGRLIASVLGVGLAYVSFDAIVSFAPIEVPRLDEAAIDGRALVFALVLCLFTAFMAGLLPAWRHSSAAPTPSRRQFEPQRRRQSSSSVSHSPRGGGRGKIRRRRCARSSAVPKHI